MKQQAWPGSAGLFVLMALATVIFSANAAPVTAEDAGSVTTDTSELPADWESQIVPDDGFAFALAAEPLSESTCEFGVWYPYISDTGVPPTSSFANRGINVTFVTGDLDAAEIAKYDVIFVGRTGMGGSGAVGTLDIAALIAFVNDGGGLISESNASIYDSDNSRGVDWSSQLSTVMGITASQVGFDYGGSNLPVAITDPNHPVTANVSSSFTLSGSHAFKPDVVVDPAKNPTAVEIASMLGPGGGPSSIVAAEYGSGRTVYFPAAVGFAGMNWAANPDYETLFLNAVEFACQDGCDCDLFSLTDFAQPMGGKRKLGSTLPVKFQLYFGGFEITSQEELDLALEAAGCEPACPSIVVTDITDAANEIELDLPEDLDNVGEGGDLGSCFRYGDGNWIYNLRLRESTFSSGRTYLVEVQIGDCVFLPGNAVFQTK